MMRLSSIKTIFILICTILIVACGNNKNSNDSSSTKEVVDKTSTEKKDSKAEKTVTETSSVTQVQSEALPAEQLTKAKEILAEVNASSIKRVDAEKTYKMHCASCHGFKGNMMVNGAKDLTKSRIDIVNSVAQVYHGKGLMTPYKGLLKSEEIVAVCQYIETLR